MPNPATRRQPKVKMMSFRIRRLLIPLTLLAGVILALPWAMGTIMRDHGLPVDLQQRLGLSARVRGLGWRHLDLGQLSWGPPGAETLEAGALTVDFTPNGLRHKGVDGVTVSGLTIHLMNGPDEVRLRGMEARGADSADPRTPPATTVARQAPHLPFTLRALAIPSARIVVHGPDNSLLDIPFRLHLEASPDHPERFLFSADLLAGGLAIHGTLDLARQTVEAAYSCPLADLARFRPELAVPGVVWTGEMEAALAPEGQWTLALESTMSGQGPGGAITLAQPGSKIVCTPIHLRGAGHGAGAAGRITLAATVDQLAAGPATLRQLSATLPWGWPEPPRPATSGQLEVKSISLHGQEIGSLGLTVTQTALTAGTGEGTLRGGTLAPLRAKITGSLSLDRESTGPRYDLSLRVLPFALQETKWPQVINLLQAKPTPTSPLALSGTLTATVTARGDAARRQFQGEVNLSHGALSLPRQKIEVSDLSGKLTIPDLLLGNNVPRATFSFAKASVGELKVTDGELTMHRDGEESLYVERIKAGWSGGTIHALGLRLQAGTPDLAGDLYCDRLDLAKLLTQLGVPQVSGQGTISGRLPFSYLAGKVRITRGLLYSPPGGGGSIRLLARDLITGGVPRGTSQFGQLSFAAAALEDFSYNWLSMGLESEGEEMVVAMSLDGHPAKALPFRYDARLGTFSEVTGKGEIGVNQPIRLDVNFRLPLNEFLGYGSSMKTLRDQLH